MYFLFSCHFYCLFFFFLLFFCYCSSNVPSCCHCVSSLPIYLLFTTVAYFICLPLFSLIQWRMRYRIPLSRCLRFQINFVWNFEFLLRMYFRIQKNHSQGYTNIILVENNNFDIILCLYLLSLLLPSIQFNKKSSDTVCKFNQYVTDSILHISAIRSSLGAPKFFL